MGRSACAAVAAVAVALGLAACGGDDEGSTDDAARGGAGGRVWIYSSLRGAPRDEADSMVKAIRLAVDEAGGRAGNFAVSYKSFHDPAGRAGVWSSEEVARDARVAAQNDRTVGFIGGYVPGADAITVPILNQAGISSISPADTYVGLTTSEPGAEKGEPERNYPSGQRTFFRLLPRDSVQAAALLTAMKQDGCSKVALANDLTTHGAAFARQLDRAAGDVGIDVLDNVAYGAVSSARAIAAGFRQQGAGCFVLAGGPTAANVRLYRSVAAVLPRRGRLYGSDRLCRQRFTNRQSGLPASVSRRFVCLLPTTRLDSYPGGPQFLEAYRRAWDDETPSPHAIIAYEAMRLYIDAIAGLGAAGFDRAAVVSALQGTLDRMRSVIGTYSFDRNGDTTRKEFGLYTVSDEGAPTFNRMIEPAK